MISRRAFLQTLLFLTGFNALLFFLHYNIRRNGIQWKDDTNITENNNNMTMKISLRNDILENNFKCSHQPNDIRDPVVITPQLIKLINQWNLSVIEPHVLSKLITQKERDELQWRFNLKPFQPNTKSLTVATLDTNINNLMLQLQNTSTVIPVSVVMGEVPFSNHTKMLHLFFQYDCTQLHLVVLHQIKHFYWIGQIPSTIQQAFLQNYNLQFGLNQEIYDPIETSSSNDAMFPYQLPIEIGHFLSQIPTSRYLHCPEERQEWNKIHNVQWSPKRITVTVEAVLLTKKLMKELRMEFWVMCGTLLGWYRQCGPIPYTTDTDFSTWPKYLKKEEFTSTLRATARHHQMRLLYRFGEPNNTMEYSLMTKRHGEKVDMFFSYSNGTHFLLPSHVVSKHTFMYSIYPTYELCSIALVGYKLLAPCDPLKVILAEYGPTWNQPSPKWNWEKSPKNSGPTYPFPKNISQYTEFRY